VRDPVHQFEVINWPSFALLSQYQYLFPRLILRINNESYYLQNLDGYLQDLGWLRMYHQYSAISPLPIVIRCPGWFLLFAANVRLDVIIV
jgi:hypothetical protein